MDKTIFLSLVLNGGRTESYGAVGLQAEQFPHTLQRDGPSVKWKIQNQMMGATMEKCNTISSFQKSWYLAETR